MKILIIEDFAGDIELLISRLGAIGCEVLVAKTSEEGLKRAREDAPDMIVTDLNLGNGMEEGIEMMARLRNDAQTAAIPLIVHSVFVSAPGDVTEATSLADGILPKPYKMLDLVKLVERVKPKA